MSCCGNCSKKGHSKCEDKCTTKVYTLIESRSFGAAIDCEKARNPDQNQDDCGRNASFDETKESSVIPNVGSKFRVKVGNPKAYVDCQWLYFCDVGKFKVCEIDDPVDGCGSITLLNDCDGDSTEIKGNLTPGNTIPKYTSFWPVAPPDCDQEEDPDQEFIDRLKRLCLDAEPIGSGEVMRSIIGCDGEGNLKAYQPPDNIDKPILVKSGNGWSAVDLETCICNILESGVCGDPDMPCSPGETVSPFLTSGSVIVPEGVTEVDIELWGAGGGSDSEGSGAPGGYTKVTIPIGNCGLMVGSTIGILVGGGGRPPGSNANPAYNGQGGDPGFGGDGLDVGSGGWAGGGGATFAFIGTQPTLPNNKADVIAIAGGGGAGNGGGGPTVLGTSGNNPANSFVAANMEGAPSGPGNAGGGGGGNLGGQAGHGGGGFACAGGVSPQLLYTSVVANGILNNPEGQSSPNYVSGKGASGQQTIVVVPGESVNGKGGDGLAAVTFRTVCP